jgi:formylglycine-generating enzyme required for sulfatase activity
MLPDRTLKFAAAITLVLFSWLLFTSQFTFAEDTDRLSKARQLFREGDLDGAIKELNRVIETLKSAEDESQRPIAAEAYYQLAKIYQVGGDDEKVADNLRQAFKAYPALNLAEPDLYFKEKADTIRQEVQREIEAAAQQSQADQERVITKEKKKKKKFPVLLVVGGIALAAVLFLLLKKDKKEPNNNGNNTGRIRVTSTPDGADIFLDGEKQSQQTPATLLNVAVGPHTVKLDKAGYEIYETDVNVVAGQEAVVSAALTAFDSGIEWVWIPPGPFSMGDDYNTGDADERPVHTVNLDGYYISRYEITFELYDKYCDETGEDRPDDNSWGRENRPVIFVTWDDAEGFCQWLSRRTGETIQLPTEAQWEKAAKGTTIRLYPWGNSTPDCNRANFSGCSGQTNTVGSSPAGQSPYGIQDMAGNVWEWCRDWYKSDYYASPEASQDNTTGPTEGTERVIRGGSWGLGPKALRCANRNSQIPTYSSNSLGFRISKQ